MHLDIRPRFTAWRYLEMSPQYHSASCKVVPFPWASVAAAGLGLGGFGGRAGRERGAWKGGAEGLKLLSQSQEPP